MAIDHTRALRRAVVYLLSNTSAVTDYVGQGVYPMRVPADASWPFIRYGSAFTQGFDPTGWDGSEHDITLTVQSHDESGCEAIAAAIQQAFEGPDLPLEGSVLLASFDWVRTQVVLMPGTDSDFQAIMQFRVQTYENA